MSAAILSAGGFGDALLMTIAAHRLQQADQRVVLFHPNPSLISSLFPSLDIQPYPPLSSFYTTFSPFNRLLLENDNSAKAWHFFKARMQGAYPQLIVFFPAPSKMALPSDFIFDPKKPFAHNLAKALDTLLNQTGENTSNGFSLPQSTLPSKRVVIHPTSQDPKRNWKKKQFLSLAEKLQKKGYEPYFSVAPYERSDWENIPFPLFSAPTLLDLAHFLQDAAYFIGNDSGVGHLASNIGIPTLTISGSPKRVALWRPGWSRGITVTPPLELPNFKTIGFRLRENMWHHFVPVGSVLRRFERELV